MIQTLLAILLIVFGLVGLIKGEFKITNKRRVDSNTGRFLGCVMLAGAGIPICTGPEFGWLIMLGALILAIVIGLSASHEIEA